MAPAANAAPLSGSSFDTGDGNQDNGLNLDWQNGASTGRVVENADPNALDSCYVGGTKENTPNQWAFNTSAGGCTPGKSNVRAAWANPESTTATTFAHFAFWRNDTTGNSFLTFELNQNTATWVNATGTTIPCRSNGDLLLSFESAGGSALATSVYRWTGDGTGPAACPNGANGSFTSSGSLGSTSFQGSMNPASITNYLNPATYGSTLPANSFGEAAINLPTVLQGMGLSPCFGFLQMQVHSRSSSSISSALIDTTSPTPVYLQSCSATGYKYQDNDGDGVRDAGEPGLPGFVFYLDLDNDGIKDAGEPSGTSDSNGFYRILNVPAGSYKIREVAQSGWLCTGPNPCYYTRSFSTGGNSTGNDFGNAAPSTASGTKYNDLDADGVQDAGEVGQSGFTFYADYDDDGVQDAGEPSGTSDGTGAWTISGIQAGTYKIREVAQSGWTCSLPSPCYYTRTFTSGTSAAGLTFSNWSTASISGNLFEDLDGDGAAKEAGEPNLSGWQVYVDANGNDAFDFGETATTTDASGNYTLSGLTPGSRTVRATLPSSSWYCTRPSQTSSACERTVTLSSGDASTGQNFGFTRYATVSGTKFDDLDADGVKDASETGAAGFVFYVDYDNDDVLDAGEPQGTSAVTTGAWTITGVKAGSYPVREVPQAGWTCTKPATTCRYDLTIASNGTYGGNEFGNHIVRSVSGTVFRDNDADGLAREAGEAGVAGWTAYADLNSNSTFDAGEPSDLTNADGFYLLTGLPNGAYRVRLVSQAGWTCSFPSGCENTGSLGNSANASDSGKDFGVWGPASISGNVFEDADADGAAKEAGESGLSGRTVFIDTDNDGTLDAGEQSTTTDGSGNYTLSGLSPGTYTVRRVLQAGWTCSRPSPCSYSVTVAGADVTGKDFGSWTTGSIAGNVYEDGNANGSKGAGEGNLAGRTVYLDLDDDGTKDAGEPETNTDGSGNYSFTRAPGTYRVRVVLAAGWTCSQPSPCNYQLTVTSQSSATARDFGLYTTGSITGTVYEDSNFNESVPDAGEAGLAGQKVYIDADDDGTLDAGETQATTDGSGAYTFSGLAPATYVVRLAPTANWTCSFPGACRRQIAVLSQATASGNNFGTYVGAEVSGTVFEDLDADGAAREPSEDGLEGERLYLDSDLDGVRDAGEPTTLTDASGAYSFTGIEAQSWHVRVDLGADWTCDSPSPCRFPLTLTSGASETSNDFGIHAPGSVSGHLYTDRDNDQQPQEFGENDQPGRTVYVDTNDDGDKDAGEPSATTDDNGDYTLDDLAPGTHRIRQELPAGWTCSTPNPCSWLVTVTSREAATDKDFSSWTDATITGFYYEDLNADAQIPDPGLNDPPLQGRTVYVDANDNDSLDGGEPQTTTDAAGKYSFANLAPGTYSIRVEAQPADWTCNYPATCEQTVTVEASETAQQNDFAAYTLGRISGTKFEDVDADGTRNAGEPGLSGEVVYLDLNDDGDKDAGEPSTTTDGSGDYALTAAPGTYDVRTVNAPGWDCTSPDPCVHTVEVVSSGDHANRDFGMEGPTEIEVTADDKSRLYGDADPQFTWSITSGSLAPGDSLTGLTCDVAGAHSDVGGYAITCSGNTNPDYDVTYQPGTLTVDPRPISVTADDKSKTYGDDDPALTYAITAGTLVDGDSLSGDITRDAGEDVGTYDITRGTLDAGSNYDLTFVPGELEITKRAITVTADDKSKTYGDDDPALTYAITAGTLVDGDSLSGEVARNAGEDVGTYDITQGTLAASSNYDMTFVAGELEITKRAITVTADDKSKVYGSDDPALTYAITAGTLVDGDSLSGDLTRDAGENVGAYDITRGTLDAGGNYDMTFVAGKLEITKRAITVTADDKSKVYGSDDPALTYAITAGTLVDGDSLSGDLTRDAGENVGTYDITRGTLDAGSNYDLTYVSGELEITKRAITVTADDKSKTYGSDDPALTYTITAGSLVDGDSLSGDLTRDAGENVGGYDITRGTLDAGSNYDLTYVPGELEITKRAITVTADDKSKTYGSDDPALTYSVTAGSLVDGDSLSGDLTRDAGENVGGYAITQGTLSASSNYDLTYVPGELTITRKPITVTAEDKSKVEGDADPAFTWSITAGALEAGDQLTSITCGVAAAHSGAGAYDIACSGNSNGNYDVTYERGTLTVTAKPAPTPEPEPEPKTPTIGTPTLSPQPTDYGIPPGVEKLEDPETGRDIYLVPTGPCVPLQLDIPIDAEPGDIEDATLTFTPADGGDPIEIEVSDTPPEPADGIWSGTLECAEDGDLHLTVTTSTGDKKEFDVGEILLIDPSGTVYDKGIYDEMSDDGATPEQARCAAAISGATVTLQRQRGDGMFVDVEASAEGLRPSINPQETGDDGTYRWDAPEGRYRVVVTKRGYWRATSGAVDVPPAVLDLHVALKRRPGTPAPEPNNCGEPPEIDSTPGCVIRPARAWVRGNEIRKVVFFLDGRRIKTVRRPDKKGRFGVLINRKQLPPGKHRVRGRVIFKRSAHRAPATVRLVLRRCIKNPAPERIATTHAAECKPFLAYVRGDSIKTVVYALDGQRLRSVRVADWNGRYGVKVDPRELRSGKHTLTARVAFVDKSGLATRTLKLPVTGCGA